MTRYALLLSLPIALAACGSAPSYADSPPAQCLVSAGYEDTGNGRTFIKDDAPRVTLTELDGVVQPLASEDDLDAYVAAGCQ